MEATARRELANLDARLERLEPVSQMWGPGQLLCVIAAPEPPPALRRYCRYVVLTLPVPAEARPLHPRPGVVT